MARNGKESSDPKEIVNKVVSDVTKKGKTLLNEGWENARMALEDNVENFKDKANDMSEKSVEEIAEDAKYYVRQHPLQSLAMALGLGVLLGFILKSD